MQVEALEQDNSPPSGLLYFPELVDESTQFQLLNQWDLFSMEKNSTLKLMLNQLQETLNNAYPQVPSLEFDTCEASLVLGDGSDSNNKGSLLACWTFGAARNVRLFSPCGKRSFRFRAEPRSAFLIMGQALFWKRQSSLTEKEPCDPSYALTMWADPQHKSVPYEREAHF